MPPPERHDPTRWTWGIRKWRRADDRHCRAPRCSAPRFHAETTVTRRSSPERLRLHPSRHRSLDLTHAPSLAGDRRGPPRLTGDVAYDQVNRPAGKGLLGVDHTSGNFDTFGYRVTDAGRQC